MKLIKSCTTFEKYQKNIFSTKSNSYFRRRYKSWLDKSNIWKSLACWLRILISNQKKTATSPKKIAPNISIRYVTKYVCNLPWIEKCDCIKEKKFLLASLGSISKISISFSYSLYRKFHVLTRLDQYGNKYDNNNE